MHRTNNTGGINYIFLGDKLVAKAGIGITTSDDSLMHYKPFGESIEEPKDDVGYTGHKFDKELGLSYMQARYYDPVIGRFYSNDPVSSVSHLSTQNGIHGFNRYTYANNNPYKYIDPTGEASYLVSRPLKGIAGSVANHNFVVTNADFVGDPNATVYSYGHNNDGKTGRVDASTKGFSEGTQKADTKAWTSLAGLDASKQNNSISEIDSSDELVDKVAESVIENTDYAAIGAAFGGLTGTNSNSAASAVANKSQGSTVPLPNNGNGSPGASAADKIQFREEQK